NLAGTQCREIVFFELIEVLEVELFAVDIQRLEGTQCLRPVTFTLKPDVDPRQKAVPRDPHRQVAGDYEQPCHGQHDFERGNGKDDVLVGGDACRVEPVADKGRDGEVGPRRLVVGNEIVFAGTHENDRRGLKQNEYFNEVRLPEAGAEEPAAAREPAGMVDLPVDNQHDDADCAQQADEFADPLVGVPVADNRPVEG